MTSSSIELTTLCYTYANVNMTCFSNVNKKKLKYVS